VEKNHQNTIQYKKDSHRGKLRSNRRKTPGCEAYHIRQYYFVEAWIELGGPLIKELSDDKNWTNNWIINILKFDGQKCKNTQLAKNSYSYLFEELKSEHSEVIQRTLREDAKIVAAMLE
jgi:hypothetical protein